MDVGRNGRSLFLHCILAGYLAGVPSKSFFLQRRDSPRRALASSTILLHTSISNSLPHPLMFSSNERRDWEIPEIPSSQDTQSAQHKAEDLRG